MPAQPFDDGTVDQRQDIPWQGRPFPAAPPADAQPVVLADLPHDLDHTPIEIDPSPDDVDQAPVVIRQSPVGLDTEAVHPELASDWGSGLANIDEIEREQAAYGGVVWPVVPWQVRGQIGTARAYIMTVFYVLRRFGRLGNLLDGPVELEDARSFRRWTILFAMLPYALTLLPAIGLWYVLRQPASSGESPAFMLALGGIVVLLGTLFIYFQSAIVGWFFCPARMDEHMRDRCLAVSRYTIAPLALAGLFMLVLPLMMPFMQFLPPAVLAAPAPPGVNPLAIPEILGAPRLSLEEFLQPVLRAMGLCQWVMLGLTAVWLTGVVVASRSLLKRSAAGIIATAVGVPVLWAAAWLAVWMLPATLAMWAMMFESML